MQAERRSGRSGEHPWRSKRAERGGTTPLVNALAVMTGVQASPALRGNVRMALVL
jgi:hypothetical protein